MMDRKDEKLRLPWLSVVGGALLWLIFVYAAYYAVHKPVAGSVIADLAGGWAILGRPGSVDAVLNTLADLGVALWIVALAAGIGQFVFRKIGVTAQPRHPGAPDKGCGYGELSGHSEPGPGHSEPGPGHSEPGPGHSESGPCHSEPAGEESGCPHFPRLVGKLALPGTPLPDSSFPQHDSPRGLVHLAVGHTENLTCHSEPAGEESRRTHTPRSFVPQGDIPWMVPNSRLESLVFGTGLGLGVIAILVFVLGLAGLWQRELFMGLGLVASVLFLPGLVGLANPFHRPRQHGGNAVIGITAAAFRSGRGIAPGRRETANSKLSAFERALLVYSGLALGLVLLTALSPPTGWDGLAYHLAAPKVYIEQGRIFSGIDVPHFYFPALVDTLFAFAMLLRSDVSAQVIHFAYLVLSAVAVFGLARQKLGRRIAFISLAVFVSVPTLIVHGTIAYVDLALVFYVTTAFWAVTNWQAEKGGRWLLIAAMLAGFAMGIKYTSAPFVVALFVMAGFASWRKAGMNGAGKDGVGVKRATTRAFGPLLMFTAVSLLVASPWFITNYSFTGNPVYPFVFGGWSWDSWRADWYGRPGTGLFTDPLRLLLAPIEATLLGIEGGNGYQATVGPLLLALLPLVVVLRKSAFIRDSLIFAVLCYLFWLGGVAYSESLEQTRLLLPVFGVLAIVAAYVLDKVTVFDRSAFRISRFLAVAFWLVLVLTLGTQVLGFLGEMPLGPVLGKETRDQYLTRRLGDHYLAMNFLNANLPPDAFVYFLYEPRTYYSDRKSQPDTLLDNWARPVFQYGSPDGILSRLQERGVTHLLVYQGGLDFLLKYQRSESNLSQVEMLMDFERKHLRLLYGAPLELVDKQGKFSLAMSEGLYSVYEVDYSIH